MDRDLIGIVRHFNRRIRNGRTLDKIFEHGLGEMEELKAEIDIRKAGGKPGPDGIVGEAIDVILCKLDLILEADPEITDEEILDIALAKCEKWRAGILAKRAYEEMAAPSQPAA